VTFTPGDDMIYITSDSLGETTTALAVSGSGITALAGDVDSSGGVDIFDLPALLKALSQQASAVKADVNSDGTIIIFSTCWSF